MRRLLAALLLAVIAIATSADLLICQDGCRDEAPVSQSQQKASLCPLCHGWGGVPETAPTTPRLDPLLVVYRYLPQLTDAHTLALEHPPKNA